MGKLYKCIPCKYETVNKSNYNRHIKSEYHKIYETNFNSDNSDINTEKLPIFGCQWCKNTFSTKQSLLRHENKTCKLNIYKQEIVKVGETEKTKQTEEIGNKDSNIRKFTEVKDMQEIRNTNDLMLNIDMKELLMDYERRLNTCEYQRKIDKYEYQIQLDKMQIESLQHQLTQQNQLSQPTQIVQQNQLNQIIQNPKTYKISIKNYVQQKYPNAPPLKELDDYNTISYEDDDFIEVLTYNYDNSILPKYLGDFIIKYYKKDNPAEQSIWASDTSRLTYLIKELLANKKSIWNHDYKGIRTKDCIINPLLNHIKKCIDDYWMAKIDIYKRSKITELNKLTKTYNSIYQIKKDIESDVLANSIIRYIAPHFCMDKKV